MLLRFEANWNLSFWYSVSSASLSSDKIDCPVLTTDPASITTFFIDAFTGLVITCSNSGNISPEALMVFSIVPVSTTAVVISDTESEDLNELRSNQIASTKTATDMTMMRMVFFLLPAKTSSGISLSINYFMNRNIPIEVPKRRC